MKKKDRVDVLCLTVIVNDTDKLANEMTRDSLREIGDKIEKIGKKKNWIQSEGGQSYGVKVGVDIIAG